MTRVYGFKDINRNGLCVKDTQIFFANVIISGSSLSDHSQLIGRGEQIALVSVVSPALVLPFGYLISRELQETSQVTWSDGNAVFDGTSLTIAGKAPIGGGDLTVAKGGSMGSTRETQTRAAPDPRDWDILQRFAARTYAPATEESRQKGAGDGSTRDD